VKPIEEKHNGNKKEQAKRSLRIQLDHFNTVRGGSLAPHQGQYEMVITELPPSWMIKP
jgi:hypothetical protein